MPDRLVSTIIPVHNRAAMLREAVASVLGQTYRPIEIVIVDDGSTDDTPAVADALAAEHPDVIRVIHQQNGGPGAAREAGRLALRGEYVQHLDSDDLLLPHKFEVQVAALLRRPECVAAYGWTRFRHPDGRVEPRPWKRTGEELGTMFPAMLQSRCWETATALYRRSALAEVGPWLPTRLEEDWEYDARIAARGLPLAYCPEWLCEYRAHPQGHASGGAQTPAKLRDRALAHRLIYTHARRAGITEEAPEMQHFARELFLLARQCGAAGLPAESRMLFELSREAGGRHLAAGQFRAYAAAARLLGWSLTGKLACMTDRLRA